MFIGIIPLAIRHLHDVYLMVSKGFRRVKRFAKEHPYQFWGIVLGLMLTVISATILPMLGFSAAGPVAGSIAAGWQSSIGIVSAGSLFAFLQSAAMGGAAMTGFVGFGVGGLALASFAAVTAIGNDRLRRARDVGNPVIERATKVGENIGGMAKKLWASWRKR